MPRKRRTSPTIEGYPYAEVQTYVEGRVETRNLTIQYLDEGTPISTKGEIEYIDFSGAGVTASQFSAGVLTITIPGGGGGTPVDYDDFKAAMQFAQLVYFTQLTYTGDDLTNKSIYTNSGMGTQLFNVDYIYSLGNLVQIVATDMVNAITYTKDLTYSSGNLISIEVT